MKEMLEYIKLCRSWLVLSMVAACCSETHLFYALCGVLISYFVASYTSFVLYFYIFSHAFVCYFFLLFLPCTFIYRQKFKKNKTTRQFA